MKIEFNPKKIERCFENKRFFSSSRVKLFNIKEATKKSSNSTHDIYYCPFCFDVRDKEDTKGKFYFQREKRIGYCFLCESVGVLDEVNREISDIELEVVLSSFKSKNTKKDLLSFNKQVINISKMFKPLDNVGKNYLINRLPIYEDLFEVLPMYSADSGVVFPVYFENKCVSYTIRNFTGKMKYFIGSSIKYFYSPNNIFTYGKNISEITLVEGVFDSLGAILNGYKNPIAMFGKDLSPFQIQLIRSICPNKINIYLDDLSLSWKLYHKIKKEFPLIGKFEVIKSFGNDPEEIYIEYLSNSESIDKKIELVNKAIEEIGDGNRAIKR